MSSKLKIGIITILKVNNYGAELQAYALQRKLQVMGFDAEIIDYLFYKHPEHIPTRASRSFVHLGVKRRLQEFIYPILTRLKQKDDVARIRLEKFEGFHLQYTRMSPTYRSMDELASARLDYDVYIVGSDQVWNPYSNTSLLPYLLHFAPDDKLKMSYASSFGVSQLPQEANPIYQKYLERFDFLSVREKTGIDIIKKLTGQEVRQVLDPTLLLTLEDWESIAINPGISKKYILVYELSPMPYIKLLAMHIRKQTGLEIIRVCKDASKHDRGEDIVNICDAGPLEFVGLFDNAEFVITNSFHGTAFAINFQKTFYSVISPAKSNNSRLMNALDTFHLKDRLLVTDDPLPSMENLCNIDWDTVKGILCQERGQSISFLLNAINYETSKIV